MELSHKKLNHAGREERVIEWGGGGRKRVRAGGFIYCVTGAL